MSRSKSGMEHFVPKVQTGAALLTVINDAGRRFNVRVVLADDRYGLNDCVVHNGAPLIEFYDAEASELLFGPRGQFVSRYYAHTLAEHSPTHGLALDMGTPEWVVSAANVRAALVWLLDTPLTWAVQS